MDVLTLEPAGIVTDPEFMHLIPQLATKELTQLQESLLENGCREPLVVWYERPECPCGGIAMRQGSGSFQCEACAAPLPVKPVLLDGHNRFDLCRKHGISFEVVEVEGVEDRNAAKAWIIKNQLGRRNIDESQRAMLAAKLKDLFAKAAAERERAGKGPDGSGGRGRVKNPVSDLTQGSPGRARDQAAAVMNVSSGLVHAAEKVQSSGTDSLQQAVMSRDASVSAAAEIATLPRKRQDAIVAEGPKAIVQAARDIRRSRSKGNAPEGGDEHQPHPRRKCKLTEKQFAELVAKVRHLKGLTDVPGSQYSPITIRECVAEILQIVM